MKSIVALTSLALVSLSSVAPCLAATQAIRRSPNQSLSSQPLPNAAKTTLVVGLNLGGLINQGIDIVNQDQRRKAEEERKAQQEKERQELLEQQEKERQEHLEAAKKQQEEREAAAVAKREAERKYVESLTPEQRKAYLAQQQKQREANAKLGQLILETMFGGGMSGSGSSASQQGGMSDQDRWNRDHQQQAPVSQPAPAPAPAIAPFYDTTQGVGR